VGEQLAEQTGQGVGSWGGRVTDPQQDGAVLEAAAMGVVHGMAGLGKTYAVEQALAQAGESAACWAAFPSRPTMRLVAARLFEQLSRGPAGRRSRFALMDQLVEELAVRPRAIVVDEAQRLTSECIEFCATCTITHAPGSR
jgi:DNA transposition AAA+ family ATPase